MSRQVKQDYTPEYRAEAVKLVTEQKLSYAEAARKLGMPEGTLAGWVHKARDKTVTVVKPGTPSVSELQQENSRLRKELAEAKMERDILKKAAAYFAKESL